MTRPRQHWRRVKTKQGIVPRIINKGLVWVKRHFQKHPGDLTPEEEKILLFRAAQRKRLETVQRAVSGRNIPEPEDIRLLRQRLQKYPYPPERGV